MPEAEAKKAQRSRALAIRVIATLVVVAALGLAAFMLASPRSRPRGALIGGPFALQDGSGKTVSDQTLKGRPFLVYFGYTHCPDVCPTELAQISDILEQDGGQAYSRPVHHRRPGARHAKGDAGLCLELQSSDDRAFGQPSSGRRSGEDLSGLSLTRASRNRTATIPWTTVRSST